MVSVAMVFFLALNKRQLTFWKSLIFTGWTLFLASTQWGY